MKNAPSSGRRRFLVNATATVGTAGLALGSVPFIQYLSPSTRDLAAGAAVEVDISGLSEGARVTVAWRRQPVWIVHRPRETLEHLEKTTDHLRDPNSDSEQQPAYARNRYRSVKPEIFVVLGICTHLSCTPSYRPEVAPTDLGPDWGGGFFCPCHGSRFDLAGRVFKGVPAPLNLVVPPHGYLPDGRILIGAEVG